MNSKIFIVLFTLTLALQSCGKEESPIVKVSNSNHPKLSKYFDDAEKYELQILYSQINRDKDNKASFENFTFNYDSSQYFYPASTVKMPVAFLALQRLNELGIDRQSIMRTDSARVPQTKAIADTTSTNGKPSVAHYIEKLFVVSDNDAYNRLYEFLGQDYINKELRSKAIFSNSRIVTRVGVSGFTTEDNRFVNPVKFIDSIGNILYQRDEDIAKGDYFTELKNTDKGIGYYDNDLDTVVNNAFDMSKKNFVNLKDLQASLMRIIFPDSYSEEQRFALEDDDYNFLYRTMQKVPNEFEYLKEQEEDYYDSYVKFFLFGDSESPMPEHIKIFNKVGYAYGYLTDCSYIIDLRNNIEFFVTTTIHVNDNQIYNDGEYEYDDGIAFLAELGRQLYNIEASREKQYNPDLSKFIFEEQ